jgi:nitroimidazol reductase NimA-like FMN-containing flavoprotein (pyridoxamine 5'-phosphate oxidase superfamily)
MQYPKTPLNKVIRGNNRAHYDQKTVFDILDAGFIGFVSYTYEGKVISIPMAYARLGESVFLHGSRKNRMLTSLLQHKEASITVMHLDGLVLARSGFHHSVNYRSVTLFGPLTEVTDNDEKNTVLKAIVDQMVPERYESLRPMNDKERNATLVVELKITSASAKIRDVGVLDEKEDMDYPVWAGIIPIKQVAFPPIPDEKLSKTLTTPPHITDYYEKHRI